MEGELEKAVQGGASGVDGGYASRGEDNVLFLCVGADIPQECRLTGAGFSREEKRTAGVLYDLECLLKLLVVEVEHFEN